MRTVERDPIVIIRLGLPYNDTGNELTTELLHRITGTVHKVSKGVYKGKEEASVVLCNLTWDRYEPHLRELLNEYKQECIFYADGQRNAWLCDAPAFDIRTEAKRQYLGELVSRPLKGWTTALPESCTIVGGNIHYVR